MVLSQLKEKDGVALALWAAENVSTNNTKRTLGRTDRARDTKQKRDNVPGTRLLKREGEERGRAGGMRKGKMSAFSP